MLFQPPLDKKLRCVARVFDRWHSHQCSRKGVVEQDGKLYCKQHDPERIKSKREAETGKFKAQWEESRRNEADADKLIKRLGFDGSPFYLHDFRNQHDGGYARAIVLKFEDVDNIIKALAR